MSTPMPSFDDELQMAAWFEATDFDPTQLEVAEDVTVSPNLRVHVEYVSGRFYTVTGDLETKEDLAFGTRASVEGPDSPYEPERKLLPA